MEATKNLGCLICFAKTKPKKGVRNLFWSPPFPFWQYQDKTFRVVCQERE
jgi:hypothetical protein